MSIYMLVFTWFIVVFSLFIKSTNATELDLNYNAEPTLYQLQQKTSYLKSQNSSTEAFKNMGADGRKNTLAADAKSRNKSAQGKGKGKGKGNGQRKGRGNHG
ncbi:MAG: hypothetical protein QM479_13940 [Pseudomonadota bacterium]